MKLDEICAAIDGMSSPELACIARRIMPKLVAVAEAARSVLSEEGVREHLSAFVMGMELMERLSALESD